MMAAIFADIATPAQLDARIAEVVARLVGEIRTAISLCIANVITSWEAAELNARFEAKIGPDLQYIRVNGAVIGALIGGGIFGLNMLPAESRRRPMKITMNVDCTPEEARTFLGQPDLKPMQDELMQEMRNRLMAGIAAMDPAEMLRTWMPATSGLEQMQDFFAKMTGGKRDK
jgi:hypothetical protein